MVNSLLQHTDRTDRYVIFIIHPSGMLTDHLGNGDGLIAWGFLAELARRGHELHVAIERAEIISELPPTMHLYQIHTHTSWEPIRRLEYMVGVRLLYRRLLRGGVRFTLMQQMNAVFLGISLAMVGIRIPLVLGTYVPRWPRHGFSRNPLIRFLRKVVVQAITRLQQCRADALLLTSSAALDRIDVDSAIRARIRYVGHGVPSSLVESATTENVESPEILFVGSLTQKKGIFVLLQAFEAVYDRFPTARLTFVGSGGDAQELRELAMQSRAAPNISFTGAIPRLSIPSFMLSCDIFCLPSFGEPYATVVIEAMACAKPIVMTDSPGLASLVPEKGRRLVPQGDVAALTRSLLEVASSPALRREMGAFNRATVVDSLTIERVVDKLEDVYRSLVSK